MQKQKTVGDWLKMTTSLREVQKRHNELTKKAYDLVSKKGHDYNRTQQANGDTLFNVKVAKNLGIVDTTTQSVLIRISDKMMRLISLTKDPTVRASIKQEKVEDTIVDMINYLVYLDCLYSEQKIDENLKELKDIVKIMNKNKK